MTTQDANSIASMASQGRGAIAIVGLGCVLPQAFGMDACWERLFEGRPAIEPLAGETWDWEALTDRGGIDPDRLKTALGGQIRGHVFDWRRFKMPPLEAERINPMQLYILDAGAQALDTLVSIPRERTALFIGATGLGWQRDSGLRIHLRRYLASLDQSEAFAALDAATREQLRSAIEARLDATLRPVSDDTVVNAAASVAIGRIAQHYHLRGLHYAVDSGFASSLAAMQSGVEALRDGSADLVVAGGASEGLTPLELVAFTRLGGLASQAVRPFDARADGTLLGEGTAMFALKRLEDARRDGETIYAVLRGVGGSSDGHGRSVVAPDPAGQAKAMTRAWADAGLSARDARFIECHGTGTVVGDASEVEAMARLLGDEAANVALGSAKSWFGHTRGAAGAVGLLKAVLQLHHRTVVAQPDFGDPNAALASASTGAAVLRVPTSHEALGDGVATAGVSAFGFGGTNFHAVVQTYAPDAAYPANVTSAAEPIAIVGMGGRFPGSSDVASFWADAMDNREHVTRIPASRWSADEYCTSPAAGTTDTAKDRSYSDRGCFVELDDLRELDVPIAPASRPHIDPSQLLAVDVAREAVRDTGAALPRNTGVYMAFLPYQGVKFTADLRINQVVYEDALGHAARALGLGELAETVRAQTRAAFSSTLPPVTEDTLPGYLGSLCAGRITTDHNTDGPHYVVDAACASTHAALHAAVGALRRGEVDAAVTGGVWCDMRPEFYVAACRFNALSKSTITPFDADADGFVPGEGAGAFVLRRLSDAQRRGDRIHAVLRSVEGSSDWQGRSVLAPTIEGEALAMQRAVEAAGVPADSVDYVECHGTGTALGDAVETEACAQVYPRGVRVGSIKSNIGHLNAAAGVPGLIKAVLAVRDGDIPASVSVSRLNPRIAKADHVTVVTRNAKWASATPRRAGVSGFGVGGANMHLIVEEYREANAGTEAQHVKVARSDGAHRPARPGAAGMPVWAASGADAPAAVAALLRAAHQGSSAEASRSATVASTAPCRVAIAVREGEDVESRVASLRLEAPGAALAAQGVFVGGEGAPRTVAMFPGQGPQYVGMCRELAATHPVARATIEELDQVYVALCGRSMVSAMWPAADGVLSAEDSHCAVFVVAVAAYRALEADGVGMDAVLGQSAGELAALVAAGVLSAADGLRAVYARTQAVLHLKVDDPGLMLAIDMGAEEVRAVLPGLGGYAAIAADNGPQNCIVSASRSAAQDLQTRCVQRGWNARVLDVSHGYHSDLIAGARAPYAEVLRTLDFRPARCPVYSTVTGGRVPQTRHYDWGDHLTRQFIEPVRLPQAFRAAMADGTRLFLECGPKKALCTFASSLAPELCAVPTMHPKVGERVQYQRAIAAAVVHGAMRGDAWRSAAPVENSNQEQGNMSKHARDAHTAEAGIELADPLAVAEAMHEVMGGFLASLRRRGLTIAVDPAARAGGAADTMNAAPDFAAADAVFDAGGSAAAKASRPAPEPGTAPAPAPTFAPTPNGPAERGDPTPTADDASHTPTRAAPAPEVPSGTATTPVPPAPAAVSGDGASADALVARLRDAFAAQTGYPVDMLECDLNLEADLGIDTVKQVAVFGQVRESMGLPIEPDLRLRDFDTIAKMAAHLAARSQSPSQSQPTPPKTTPSTGVAVALVVESPPQGREAPLAGADASGALCEDVRAELARTTGYPIDMLELDLDLEADLGIDTVKQAAVVGTVRERLQVGPDPEVRLRDLNTIRKLAQYLAGRLSHGDAAANANEAHHVPPPTPDADASPGGAAAVVGEAASVGGALALLARGAERSGGWAATGVELIDRPAHGRVQIVGGGERTEFRDGTGALLRCVPRPMGTVPGADALVRAYLDRLEGAEDRMLHRAADRVLWSLPMDGEDLWTLARRGCALTLREMTSEDAGEWHALRRVAIGACGPNEGHVLCSVRLGSRVSGFWRADIDLWGSDERHLAGVEGVRVASAPNSRSVG